MIQLEAKGSVQFGPLKAHRFVKTNRIGLRTNLLIRLLIDCGTHSTVNPEDQTLEEHTSVIVPRPVLQLGMIQKCHSQAHR